MMAFLAAHPALTPWVIYALSTVTFASAIDCTLPQPAPGSYWTPFRRLVSYAALNFGPAANLRSPAMRVWLVRMLSLALSLEPGGSALVLLGTLAEKLAAVSVPPAAAVPASAAASAVPPAAPAPPDGGSPHG
jgi:hypothetical protein